jgi:MFS family permease
MVRRADPTRQAESRTRDASRSRARALALLATTSAIGGSGLAAGGTAGALLGAQLTGTEAAAGLPLGVLVLGSAASALLISRSTSQLGRGLSLALGYAVGVAGALLVVLAAVIASLTTLLLGSLLLGGANASIFLTRYAAAEVGGEAGGGRALGLVFFSTSIGAVASPLLLGPSGDLAQNVGLPRLSGLYAIACVAFSVAGLLLGGASHTIRPGHAGVAALLRADETTPPTWRELADGADAGPATFGVAVLATVNFVMVAVMAVAPVHLMAHGQSLEMIGTAISAHVAGMFAPSPISGWLTDRVGPLAVVAIGFLLVLIAAVYGVTINQADAHAITVMLVILGVGWNFGVVGASALIAGSAPLAFRVQVEGIGEVAMGIAAAVAAPAASLIIAVAGFTSLSLLVATLAALAIASTTRRASLLRA